MKKFVSLLLVLAAVVTMAVPAGAAFSDITDAQTQREVSVLQMMGVINGTSDTTFSPGGTLTRAQFCKMAVVLMGRAPYISTMRLPGEEDRQIARDAMEQMCITHLARRPFTELSGGERQQVMIARLLTQQPRLILMDEPTSALDFGNQQRTIRMIRDLSRRGFAVIMTTHDPDHAVMLGDKVGTIDREGRFLFGPADEIITSETLSRLYNTDILVEYIPSFGRKVCGCT